MKKLDFDKYIGKKYGKLVIIGEGLRMGNKIKRRSFICKCDCGNKKQILMSDIIHKGIKSCGCLRGYKGTHKMSNKKIYHVYSSILQRCNDKNKKEYKNYGGRGIQCERKSFEEFYRDMGPTYQEGLSIDRIDNDGNYCKKNCRWTTRKIQNNNQRSNHIITYKGKTKNATQRSEELGIKSSTFRARIYRNKGNIEKIFY